MASFGITRSQLWDYFILAARVLLAVTFISYGYSKLVGSQFGLSAAQAALPVGQLGLFKLSWYLFGQEPFRSFVGIAQVVAGLLLLWNRTALLGALLLLPIAANVLIIDLTYLKMLPAFQWRLSYYIGLLFLIFWHYRGRMRTAWQALTHGLTTHFRHPWWAYLLLPLSAILVDLVWVLPRLLYSFCRHPAETWRSTMALIQSVLTHFGS